MISKVKWHEGYERVLALDEPFFLAQSIRSIEVIRHKTTGLHVLAPRNMISRLRAGKVVAQVDHDMPIDRRRYRVTHAGKIALARKEIVIVERTPAQ